MPYRPYPNADRALRELARKESRSTHEVYAMPHGVIGEDHAFPGQALAIFAARFRKAAASCGADRVDFWTTTA